MDRKLSLLVQFASADRLSGSLRKIAGLSDSGTTALAKLKREARTLDTQLKDVRARLDSGSMQGGLIMAERELRRAIDETSRAIQRRQRFIEIDNRVNKMQAKASSYKSAGQSNMVGGATALAPFVAAGQQAMAFSSGMVDIQQKADLTNAATAKMAANILAAARAAHQLPESMREGVDILAGLGMDPRQAAAIIEPIGRASTAFKAEMGDLSAATFANLNSLKVAAGDTAKSIDIMAAASNAGAFELKDMAKWFPSLTAQAQALGQKGTPAVADLSAALQIARRATGSADEAGNNIQNLLAKINAKGTIDAFKKNFGVDLPNALKAAYAKGKTPLEAIAEVTQQATGGDLSRLSFAFEDMQAQGAVRALIQNLEEYRQMRDNIAKSGGTVDRAFGQREMQDASIAWQSFKGQLSGTAILLGTTLLPATSRFLGSLNNVLGAVGDWAQANPGLASGMVSLVASLAVARIGLGALQFAFGGLLGPMATAWGWWQKYKALGTVAAAFPRIAQAFGMLRTAAIFLGQGFMRAGLMMLANPMVLIIAAIGAAIGGAAYLIYTHWDTIKAAFASGLAYLGQAWGWIKTKFSEGLSFLQELPSRMATIGRQMIEGLVRGLLVAPLAVSSALSRIVLGGIDRVKSLLGIKSPSRLFMGIGGYVTEGLAIGVNRGAGAPMRAAGRMAAGVAAAGMVPLGGAGAGGRLAASGGGGDTYHITIVQQPGEDAQALAERVAELIAGKKRNAGLGSFRDA